MMKLSEKTSSYLVNNSTKMARFLAMNLLSPGSVWLAGGAIRSCFDDSEISDFDLFFRVDGFFPSNHYVNVVKKKLLSEGYKITFECPEGKLTTFNNDEKTMKIQLITERYYGGVEDLLSTFDITAARFVYDGVNIHTFYSSIRDSWNLKVNLHSITHPAATMKRIQKYVQKGYKLTNTAVDMFIDRIYVAGLNREQLDRRFYID